MEFLDKNEIIELELKSKFYQELPNSIYQSLKSLKIYIFDFIEFNKF
jgi:hypothetical protein